MADRRSPPHPTEVGRTVHSVFMDMENVHHDVRRLAFALEMVGTFARADGIGAQYGGGVEILGELIGERALRLSALLDEGVALNGQAAHG